MRELYHPPRECLEMTQVLHALSDPIRLCIVRQLAARGDLPCGTFCERAPKSTMSHHFKVLRQSGIIHQRAEGTSCFNTLRRTDLDARFPGLLEAVLGAPRIGCGFEDDDELENNLGNELGNNLSGELSEVARSR